MDVPDRGNCTSTFWCPTATASLNQTDIDHKSHTLKAQDNIPERAFKYCHLHHTIKHWKYHYCKSYGLDSIFLLDNHIIMSESKLPSKHAVKLNILRCASCFQMLTYDSIHGTLLWVIVMRKWKHCVCVSLLTTPGSTSTRQRDDNNLLYTIFLTGHKQRDKFKACR